MPKFELIDLSLVDGVQLLVWEATESMAELKSQLTLLDDAELASKTTEKRKFEYLSVRVALKNLLGAEMTIHYDAEGKPFIVDSSVQISISHSGKWVAVAAHPSQLIGVDIEVPSAKIQKVYTRFLSEIEQKDLSNGEDIRQLQLAWSSKEAMYKIIGKEAVDFAKQLRIFPFEVQGFGTISAEHVPTQKTFELHYSQNSDYTLLYCLDKKPASHELI